MRVVDANVLLSYLLADHERHYAQAAAFRARISVIPPYRRCYIKGRGALSQETGQQAATSRQW